MQAANFAMSFSLPSPTTFLLPFGCFQIAISQSGSLGRQPREEIGGTNVASYL